MVRRNSIEASTRSSMAKSELIRGSVSPYQADLKFLCGDSSRLVQTTDALTEKFESIEAKMDANFNELRRTLTQLSNQLGIRPIEAETSRQTSPVTFSDAYVRDDPNRLPLVNRKSLLRKIDMPKFDGSNAYDWLSKVERFFRVGRYSDFDKLDLVSLSLEGDVLKWFNWQLIRREFRSWEDFRRRLFRKFGAAPEQSPRNRLFALKQTGTVSAYVTEFEELSSQVVGLDELYLEQIFYKGLKTEMRDVLRLKDPEGLENQKNAVLRMETSSFCQLFNENPSRPGGTQQNFTSRPVTTYTQPKPLLLQNGENLGAGQVTTTPATRPNAAGVQPQQKIIEDVSENVADILEVKKLILQCQVPVSKLQEHSLQMHNESPNVCENYQAVVGCDELGSEENMFSGLSQTSQVWEPGGVLAAWSAEAQLVFDSLKQTMAAAPVLGLPEFDKPFVLETDGSGTGVGAVLLQNRKPLAYFSHALTTREQLKPSLSFSSETLDVSGSWPCAIVSNNPVHSQDPRGLGQLILDDLKSHLRHKWKSKHLRAVYLQTTPSYALDVVNKPVTECKNDRVIATDLERQAVLDQITTGLAMKKKMKVLKSWMFKYKPATSSSMLPLYAYQLGVSDKEMVADPVTQSLLGTLLWSTSFKKQKFCKDWWFKFKYNIAYGRESVARNCWK